MADWSAGSIYYNGVLYDNEHDFRSAWQKPDFRRASVNNDGAWSDTEDFESQPEGRELPPPISVQPHGPRYKLDREQQYVHWFGFEFYISTTQATGLSLFDIRFKGQRVMYELGLQEALAHYAGDDPMQGGLEFLDTFFGMGRVISIVQIWRETYHADCLRSKIYIPGDDIACRESSNSPSPGTCSSWSQDMR
jgi:primary-amine oxidase